MIRPAIPYFRVSTKRQRRSGLGIGAQREAVQRFAEKERTLISERTKVAPAMKRESLRQAREALEAAGKEPVRTLKDGRQAPMRLGNPNGAAHLKSYGNTAAFETVRSQATVRATGLQTIIEGLRQEGITSANAMAKALNARLVATHSGGQLTARSVLSALGRLSA